MSTLLEPRQVKLFTSLIYGREASLKDCTESLSGELGDIDYKSVDMPFDYTKYYEEEMGTGLRRVIITFRDLIKREEIAEIAQEHLILATGKGYAHRPYLGKGVYADLTLIYSNYEFRALEWTYPDYGSADMRELFRKLRNEYMNQMREVYKQ
jgi:hypothetical protein